MYIFGFLARRRSLLSDGRKWDVSNGTDTRQQSARITWYKPVAGCKPFPKYDMPPSKCTCMRWWHSSATSKYVERLLGSTSSGAHIILLSTSTPWPEKAIKSNAPLVPATACKASRNPCWKSARVAPCTLMTSGCKVRTSWDRMSKTASVIFRANCRMCSYQLP